MGGRTASWRWKAGGGSSGDNRGDGKTHTHVNVNVNTNTQHKTPRCQHNTTQYNASRHNPPSPACYADDIDAETLNRLFRTRKWMVLLSGFACFARNGLYCIVLYCIVLYCIVFKPPFSTAARCQCSPRPWRSRWPSPSPSSKFFIMCFP